MTTFFTSDLHIGHRNISRLSGRPFDDSDAGVDAMNERMVETWNQTVSHDDVVFLVGDFAMGRIAESLGYVARLNGTKHLISGNHDRCWVGASGTPAKIADWAAKYVDAGFVSVADSMTYYVGGDMDRPVPVSHFPYTGESFGGREDRYTEFRPVDDGGWLVHGHVHEQWRQRCYEINVGIDAWGGHLVPASTIDAMIDDGPKNLARIEWETI